MSGVVRLLLAFDASIDAIVLGYFVIKYKIGPFLESHSDRPSLEPVADRVGQLKRSSKL